MHLFKEEFEMKHIEYIANLRVIVSVINVEARYAGFVN